MITCYISGPIRGIKDSNFPAFDKARDLGITLGYNIISPADMDRQDKDRVESKTPNINKELCLRYAKRDTEAILRSNAIAMLPGWETSVGAKAEYALAVWLQLEILDATSFLPLEEKQIIIKDKCETSIFQNV